MKEGKSYTYDEIAAVMPQQEPFLFLQKATVFDDSAVGEYKISGDEFFLKGHFKDNPVFPGTLMLETLGQLCVFFLLKTQNVEIQKPVDPKKIFAISTEMARCTRICKPDDTMMIQMQVLRLRHPVGLFRASLSVNGERAAFVDRISFAFDYKTD